MARGQGVAWRLATTVALLLTLLTGLAARPDEAAAATCAVTTTADSGAGSLRAHLADITCDTITIQAGLTGTITLGSDLPIVTRVVSVTSSDGARLTIDRNNAAGGVAFRVGTWGALTISGLTVTGARDGVSLVANSWATIAASTLRGNATGVVFNQGGSATLANSTLNGNATGVAFNQGGSATLANSTLNGNATGLAFASGGSASLANSLLARGAGANCAVVGGTLTNGGHNLADDASCFADGANNSMVVAAGQAGLDQAGLKDNGGPTRTIALTATSPAIDAGDAALCAQTPVSNADQRGAARPSGAGCDIGAVERGPAPVGGCVVTTNLDGLSPVPVGSLREKLNDPDCGAISMAPTVISPINLSGNTLSVANRVVVITGARIQPGGVAFTLGAKGDLALVGGVVLGATIAVSANAAATQASLVVSGGSTITASGSIVKFDGGGLVTIANSTLSSGGTGVSLAGGGAVTVASSTVVAGGTVVSLVGGGAVTVASSTIVAGGTMVSLAGGGATTVTGSTITAGGTMMNFPDGGTVSMADSTSTAGSWVMRFGGLGSATVVGGTTSGPSGLISFVGQGSATVNRGRFTAAAGPGIIFGGTGTAMLNAAEFRTFGDTLSFGGGGTATVAATVFFSNTGNGLVLGSGTMATLTNSTINVAGAAVSLAGSSAVTVRNSTLAANTANLGFSSGGTAALTNSLLAKRGGANCTGGTPTSNNHNLADDATCFADSSGPGGASRVVTTADLGLDGGLGNNGGPTPTIALTATSVARDAGDDTVCAQTGPGAVQGIDQRGRSRFVAAGSHCDIGAFEYDSAVTVTALAVAPASGPYAGTANLSATLTRFLDGAPIAGKPIAFTLNGGSACATCPATDGMGVARLAASLGTIPLGNYPAGVGGSFAGDSTNTPASASAALTVGIASQLITLSPDPLPDRVSGDAPFTVTATASSGQPVSLAAGPAGACTISGTTVTIVAQGTCTVVASQAGNGNYLAAPEVIRSFRIAQGTTALSLVRGEATYGAAGATLIATLRRTNGNLGPVVGATVSFTFNGVPVGGATTNAQGVATLAGVALPAGLGAGSYANAVCASFAGGSGHLGTGPTCGPLVIARRVLWLKPIDRTVVFQQPNPPATPPAGCLVTQTATAACWLQLINGSAFVNGDDWADLNLVNLRFQYARSYPTSNSTESVGKTYRISASGLANPNYDIRYATGMLTVVAAP